MAKIKDILYCFSLYLELVPQQYSTLHIILRSPSPSFSYLPGLHNFIIISIYDLHICLRYIQNLPGLVFNFITVSIIDLYHIFSSLSSISISIMYHPFFIPISISINISNLHLRFQSHLQIIFLLLSKRYPYLSSMSS